MAAVSTTLRPTARLLRCCFPVNQTHQYGPVGALSNYFQVRGKKQNVAQYNLQHEWLVPKKSAIRDEEITLDNEQFVKEVISNTYRNTAPVLKDDIAVESQEYQKWTRRCGLITLKIGVIPQWTKEGKKIMVTLLQAIDNHVIRYTPPEMFITSSGWKPWWKQRFGSMVVGSMSADPRLFTRNYVNIFTEAGVPPKKILTRFLVTPNSALQPGTPLSAMHFRVGDYVDVQARTIDHGFQGVVKRWGMKGMPKTHGTTKAHRKMGSSGSGRRKSGIWKGKKMPGHMGNKWRILKGLKIWRINTKYNVLYVSGGNLPGHTHGVVRVYDTILPLKRSGPDNHPPFPTWTGEGHSQDLPLEFWDDNLHRMSDPSLTFE